MTKPSSLEWLAEQWEFEVPEAPQTGSIEERAERLLVMHRDREHRLKAPKLLQTLALDLMWASFPDGAEPPEPVLKLMNIALGLPPEHIPCDWVPEDLDNRGNPDHAAQDAAWQIDHTCIAAGVPLSSPRAMARQLKAMGFKTSPSTVRKWRQQPDWAA